MEESLQNIKYSPAKAEVLIAELLETGLLESLDKLILHPEGLLNRPHSPDITKVEILPSKVGKENLINLYLSREGIYDTLPEALFHQSKGRRGFKKVDEMVEESKRQRKLEEGARTFFLPFEQEFFRKRIELEQLERSFFFNISEELLSSLFADFYRSAEQAVSADSRLFYLFPLAHLIAGDHSLMEECFALALDEKIELIEVPPGVISNEEELLPCLGSATLGVDMVCGDAVEISTPQFILNIGPVSLDSIEDFLEGGKKNALIRLLIDYFTPLEMDIETNIFVDRMEAFLLSPDRAAARLGYSTSI